MVEEKVQAKRKLIEEECLPLINSRAEANQKVDHLVQKYDYFYKKGYY